MPSTDTILNQNCDCRFLSSIDLKQDLFQVPLEESSLTKTAFAVHGRNLFDFKLMHFGLSCSSQTMYRLMDGLDLL